MAVGTAVCLILTAGYWLSSRKVVVTHGAGTSKDPPPSVAGNQETTVQTAHLPAEYTNLLDAIELQDLLAQVRARLAHKGNAKTDLPSLLRLVVAQGTNAVPGLEAMLEGSITQEREYAAAALCKIGAKSGVTSVVKAIEACATARERDNLREALQYVTHPEGLLALVETFGQRRNRDLVEAAKETVAANASPEVLREIVNRLRAEEESMDRKNNDLVRDGVQCLMRIKREDSRSP